jgi:UDP-glucuronate 4-epimerase
LAGRREAIVAIVVTGCAGFIGSHVARALLARGERVLGIDNFDPFYPATLKRANLDRLTAAGGPRFGFVEVDVADERALEAALRGAAFDGATVGGGGGAGVIHLAAKAGVRPSVDDPAGYARANVVGTASVLKVASALGLRRAVCASSSSVYGNCPTAPFHEELDVDRPISPYAATKRAGEILAWTHARLTGMPVAMLRFFTVYGPGQRPDLAISLFLRAAAEGRPIGVFGSPESERDYTYIDDIVAGVLAAYDRIDAHGYRVWNLGGSRPVKLAGLLELVERVTGRPLLRRAEPPRAGDVERTWADLTRARAELGFDPRTGIEQGVARQWAWMSGT